MDSAVVSTLAQVLDDRGNGRINSEGAKSQIAAILSGKSMAEVLRELDAHISKLPGKERGKTVLIVIMALLRLDLGSVHALAQEIQERKYKLVGPLYGGLAELFKGKNQNFTFQLLIPGRGTRNAYEEIERWDGHLFGPHIHLFLTAKLLYDVDPRCFERLALEDPSGVLLLSMIQGHLPITPSDGLLKKLLESPNPIHSNFAFAFYVQPIPILCDRIEWKRRKRGEIKRLNEYVDRCLTALAPCSPALRAELLTNYVLVHQRAFPAAFARQLVGAELQCEFARQIAKTGKIRTIQELSTIVNLIINTPACNAQKHRISKRPLADAVLSVLIRFVQERTGIFAMDDRWREDAKEVLHLLTAEQRGRLGRFLNRQDEALMINPLDKLVRFDIYLKDIRQHQIIQGLKACLAYAP